MVIYFLFFCCKVYLVALLVYLEYCLNSFRLTYWTRKRWTWPEEYIYKNTDVLEINGQRIKWQASFIWHYLLRPSNWKPDGHFASGKCQQVIKPNPGSTFCGYLQYRLVPRVTEVELSFSFDARLYQQILKRMYCTRNLCELPKPEEWLLWQKPFGMWHS